MSKPNELNSWYIVHRLDEDGKRTPVGQSRSWDCLRPIALGVMLREGDCDLEVKQGDNPPYPGVKVVNP